MVNFYSLNLPPAVSEGPSGVQQGLLRSLPRTVLPPGPPANTYCHASIYLLLPSVIDSHCSPCRLIPPSLLLLLS